MDSSDRSHYIEFPKLHALLCLHGGYEKAENFHRDPWGHGGRVELLYRQYMSLNPVQKLTQFADQVERELKKEGL